MSTTDYKVKVARKQTSKMDLSCQHITTMNFGSIKPVYSRLLVPGDNFTVKAKNFTRLMPMPSPTFGQIDLRTRGYFVPLRLLFSNYEEVVRAKKSYIHDSKGASSTVSGSIPYVSTSVLAASLMGVEPFLGIFTSSDFFTVTSTGTHEKSEIEQWFKDHSSSYICYAYEMQQPQVSTSVRCVSMTPTYLGKRVLDVLNSLGYVFDWSYVVGCLDAFASSNSGHFGTWSAPTIAPDLTLHPTQYNSLSNDKVSLLPLLSYFRVMADWVLPARFYVPTLQFVYSLCDIATRSDYQMPKDSYDGSAMSGDELDYGGSCQSNVYYQGTTLTWEVLRKLFRMSELFTGVLPNDYFTSAFSNPYGSEDAETLSLSFDVRTAGSWVGSKVFTNEDSSISDATHGQAVYDLSSGGRFLTQFGVQALGALQDLANRGKLSGEHFRNWYKNTFGVVPPSGSVPQSSYLGSQSDTINIGDVMSTAGTSENALGQYAGRGLGATEKTFKVDADEFGMMLILHDVQTPSSYPYGRNVDLDVIDSYDIYHPEFDGLGCEAIPQHRLQATYLKSDGFATDSVPNTVFGWAPRYSGYKMSQDRVSGDFLVPEYNTGLQSWYLARYWTRERTETGKGMFIDGPFLMAGISEDGQVSYDQIFTSTSNMTDKFYEIWRFDVFAVRPMISLKDTYTFDESGKEEETDINS